MTRARGPCSLNPTGALPCPALRHLNDPFFSLGSSFNRDLLNEVHFIDIIITAVPLHMHRKTRTFSTEPDKCSSIRLHDSAYSTIPFGLHLKEGSIVLCRGKEKEGTCRTSFVSWVQLPQGSSHFDFLHPVLSPALRLKLY